MQLPPLSPEQAVKPPRYELRMSLLFGAMFLPMGIHLPYFPLWLADRGFTASEVAMILSMPIFVRIVAAPLVTMLADRAPERANVLIGVAAAALLLSLGYFLPGDAAFVLAVSLALIVVWSPHGPLADSLALSGVRRYGADYSRMRIWGTISFLTANLVGGAVLERHGPGVVPALLTGGLACMALVSLLSPRLGRPRKASQLSAADFPGAGRVLSDPAFLAIVGGGALLIASHGFLYAFGSIYWRSLGIAADTAGVLWALMVVAEVVVFFLFRRHFGHLSPATILGISAAAGVVRWAAMPLIWPLGLGLAGFAATQALHGLSTGLAMLGLQKMIAQSVPEERTGAAQGIAFAANSTGMAIVTLGSGSLFDALGARGFLVMAVIATGAFVLALVALRLELRGG
ncbi:MFS transporter [Aquibium microcysteis]|uniref:MFS transporter n=1 Tax=Aquibium microcysteis TaxID=675281 RepID=UPI00165CF2B4|nr:MFS transporter [Aquibium microcysteis]